MKISRSTTPTAVASPDWFTGNVYVDTVATPVDGSGVSTAVVHFAPGARTAWHVHPRGQTLWITEGVGRCQRRGGPVEELRAGDRVFFEPGEDHWHGAAPDRFMAHVAVAVADDIGSVVTWGDHVTDADYGQNAR